MGFPVGWSGGSPQSTSAVGMGYGQAWADVTSSRAIGTTYYNTTGKPIAVGVTFNGAASTYGSITVNGVLLVGTAAPNGTADGAFAIVPPGGSYSAVNNASVTLNKWVELR